MKQRSSATSSYQILAQAFLGVMFSINFFTFAKSAYPQVPTCETVTRNIRTLLDYKQCRKSSDCVLVQLPQPFGCNHAINESFLSQVNQLCVQYEKLCGPYAYQCPNPASSISCRKGRCEARVILKGRMPDGKTRNHHGR